MIFPLSHFRHGKGWPWNQKTQHSRHVRKRFQYLKALIPESSDGIQCLWRFFLHFFWWPKKEWWCFPRIYGSSSSLSCVSMGIAVLAPFFYQCVICYLGFKPQFLHRVMLPGEDPGILWGYGRYPVLEHTLFGGELPTNRGCGFVHPSDWHGISRVNPLITGVITHWATK
jgi:hypothetical protein